MNMQEYILKIINSQPIIKKSWGFNTPVAIENGLRFSVQGFLHKGHVEVVYCYGPDLFEVRLLNPGFTLKEKIDDVSLSELVGVIDRKVEYVDRKTYLEMVFGINRNEQNHAAAE